MPFIGSPFAQACAALRSRLSTSPRKFGGYCIRYGRACYYSLGSNDVIASSREKKPRHRRGFLFYAIDVEFIL